MTRPRARRPNRRILAAHLRWVERMEAELQASRESIARKLDAKRALYEAERRAAAGAEPPPARPPG